MRVVTDGRTEHFDRLVLATHSDHPWRCWPTPQGGKAVLGAIRYQPNHAVLHTDTSVLPTRRAAWAAWNYERAPQNGEGSAQVCLHHLLNQLQPLPFSQPVVVSLNPVRAIDPARVLGRYDYAHPVFDLAAIRAQPPGQLQGRQHTWFCGAWTGYGFTKTASSPAWLRSSSCAPPCRTAGGGRMKTDRLFGFGEVRHTRLRPRHHAFVYPTCFLMLPMRSLPEAAEAQGHQPARCPELLRHRPRRWPHACARRRPGLAGRAAAGRGH